MNTNKKSLFVTDDGRDLRFTFILVSWLLLLRGFCNGMIDMMEKHFQEELRFNPAQSAWVRFAHYLGYFLMSLPAGWLATRLACKGGIIAGLLMGAVADRYGMSRGFIVPKVCFIGVAGCGYNRPKFSKAESLHGVGGSGGH